MKSPKVTTIKAAELLADVNYLNTPRKKIKGSRLPYMYLRTKTAGMTAVFVRDETQQDVLQAFALPQEMRTKLVALKGKDKADCPFLPAKNEEQHAANVAAVKEYIDKLAENGEKTKLANLQEIVDRLAIYAPELDAHIEAAEVAKLESKKAWEAASNAV